mgnify:FL=1
MIFIYLIIAISFIDTFSQLPIIATFSLSVGATPLVVGVIIGMYSFSNIIGNLLSGLWIDKIGPKRILSIGMIIVGFIVLLYTFVSGPYQLLFVRFLHGLAGGFIVPAAFTLLGSSKKHGAKRGKTMAFSGAAVGAAAIIGPAFGAIISGRFGFEWLFCSISLLMILFGILALFFLKERAQVPRESRQESGSFYSLLKTPILKAYISIFLLMFAQGILTYSLPLKVASLSIKPEMTGMLLSVFGIVAILFFVLPTNKLFDIVKRKTSLMMYGLVLISIALMFLSFSTELKHLIGSMFVYGIGFALLFPSTSATIVENTEENMRGKTFGIYYACFSVGVVTGAVAAGFFTNNITAMFLFGAAAVFFFSLFIQLLGRYNRLEFVKALK